MTIAELINHIGSEHIKVQWLPECQKSAYARKNHTEITFATNGVTCSEFAAEVIHGKPPTNVGLVVWLPVERLPDEIKTRLGY